MLTSPPSITGIWVYGPRAGTTAEFRREAHTWSERPAVIGGMEASGHSKASTLCPTSLFSLPRCLCQRASNSNPRFYRSIIDVVAYQSDCFQVTQTQPSKVHRQRKSEDADVFLAALQTCGAAAELFTLITLLLMAAGCQSGCRSLQALMWPVQFWEREGGGSG